MSRLTVVSNRLPIVLKRDPRRGDFTVAPATGGLVHAMAPLLEKRGGGWVGWPGLVTEEGQPPPLSTLVDRTGYHLEPVQLSNADVAGFYTGFANSILWPLLHGLSERCDFRAEFWDAYQRVNTAFARAVHRRERPEESDLLWVHDYHLIPAGEKLRELGERGRIGFFLHTPFPNLQEYVKLPWRAQLLRAFLAYDLVGFQTSRDRRNFLECVDRLMPDARVSLDDPLSQIRVGGHTTYAGAFPIGIDYEAWQERATARRTYALVSSIREGLGPYRILLGVDRLDYTKGLLERLEAFRVALERYPDLRERIVFLQIVVPSRESVPEYRALKRRLDREVGRILGRYATTRWDPVRYLYGKVAPDELVALYRLASVCLVTPICDGMNLIAKEYCASQVDETGVLVLSEMAGAAAQLADHALLVNPFDQERTADAIYQAVTMETDERRRRMRALRAVIRDSDVFWWGRSFLEALREPRAPGGQASDIEYLPTIEARRGQRGNPLR